MKAISSSPPVAVPGIIGQVASRHPESVRELLKKGSQQSLILIIQILAVVQV